MADGALPPDSGPSVPWPGSARRRGGPGSTPRPLPSRAAGRRARHRGAQSARARPHDASGARAVRPLQACHGLCVRFGRPVPASPAHRAVSLSASCRAGGGNGSRDRAGRRRDRLDGCSGWAGRPPSPRGPGPESDPWPVAAAGGRSSARSSPGARQHLASSRGGLQDCPVGRPGAPAGHVLAPAGRGTGASTAGGRPRRGPPPGRRTGRNRGFRSPPRPAPAADGYHARQGRTSGRPRGASAGDGGGEAVHAERARRFAAPGLMNGVR